MPTVEDGLDKVKVTVVDAFYEINLTTFIPFDAFYGPGQTATETVTGGDNRGFDRTSTEFRTRHLVMVTPFVEFDTDGLLGEKKEDGWSHEYDAPTSLLNYDPNETDPDELQLKQIAKDEEEIEANKGIPYKKDWAQGDAASLLRNITRLNMGVPDPDRGIYINLIGDESNPLWELWDNGLNGSPGITYDFRMWMNTQNILAPTVLIEGEHDGFPAYEIYFDSTTIYTYDPRTTGETVLSWFTVNWNFSTFSLAN